MVKITNINDSKLRRKICIDTFAINPYIPNELLYYIKTNKLDKDTNLSEFLNNDKFIDIYSIENIYDNVECKQSLQILFLQDVVNNIIVNKENLDQIKDIFRIDEDTILSAWASRQKKFKDDWQSIYPYMSNDMLTKRKNKYKEQGNNRSIPSYRSKNTIIAFKEKILSNHSSFQADNFMVKSMNIDMILQTKDKKYIDPLNIFNKLPVSMMIPFIQINGFIKTFNDAFIPSSWVADKNNKIFVALRPTQIPEKLIQIKSKDNLSLILNPNSFLDASMDEIKAVFKTNNIDLDHVKYLKSEINRVKNYIQNFVKITLQFDKNRIYITAKIVADSVNINYGKHIIDKIFGNKYDIVQIKPGDLDISFRFLDTVIEGDLFLDIINNYEQFPKLVLFPEYKKPVMIETEKQKAKGSFRIIFKVYNINLTCYVQQNSGDKRSNHKPYILLHVASAPSKSSVQFLANMFSSMLTIYNSEKSKYFEVYKENKIISILPDIKDSASFCETDKECNKGKGVCNPVTKKCSANVSTTQWWIENYSRTCQRVIPWVVDPDTVEMVKKMGYQVQEFPKNSGQFLSCPKVKKNNKMSDKFYLLDNLLPNNDKYPYLPCCGTDDRRVQAGAQYNKYYYNLSNLDLNNGTKIEATFSGVHLAIIKKILNINIPLSVIGFDFQTNKFLSAPNIKLTDIQIQKIKEVTEDPQGALLFEEVNNNLVVSIFLEIEMIEFEKKIFEDSDELILALGVVKFLQTLNFKPKIKFFIDRLKRNEDLNTDKRATIGRKGLLTPNIERLLNLASLSYTGNNSTWRRYGVTRDSSASFLHVLKVFINNETISNDSSFAIRKYFMDKILAKGLNSLYLCSQSMENINIDEIKKILDPNNPDNAYIDPRYFHALAEYVLDINIILIKKDLSDSEAKFVLPYHSNLYRTTQTKSNRTVIVYEHYGMDTNKSGRNPNCELVLGPYDDNFNKFMYRAWLYSTQFLYGDNLMKPINVPDIFYDGWYQVVNDHGVGYKLVKNDIVLITSLLPPLPFEITEQNMYMTLSQKNNVSTYLKSLGAVINDISENEYNKYTKIIWIVDDFVFYTIFWNNVTSHRQQFLINKKSAKFLKGYLNYTFSKYLTKIKFSLSLLFSKLDKNNVKDTVNTVDCVMGELIDQFFDKHISTERVNTKCICENVLPPPRILFRNNKLYINHENFTKNTVEHLDELIQKLKYFLKLQTQHELDMLLNYSKFNSMIGFFETLSDFFMKDTVTIKEASYTSENEMLDIKKIQSVPLLNTGINYFLKNKNTTSNELCFARSFLVKTKQDINMIAYWFSENYGKNFQNDPIDIKNSSTIKNHMAKHNAFVLKISDSFYIGLIKYNYEDSEEDSDEDSEEDSDEDIE